MSALRQVNSRFPSILNGTQRSQLSQLRHRTISALGSHVGLSDGQMMPQLGFGTWQSEPGVVGAAVQEALQAGYRHIDCAKVYRNQPEIGDAFSAALKEHRYVKREELFVVSKLWTTDMHPDNAQKAIHETLRDLQLDYLDLYLIHWPVAWENTGKWEVDDDYYPKNAQSGMAREVDVPLMDTWGAMEEMVNQGLVRSIGVCNAREEHIDELVNKCTKHSVELHAMLQQRELKKYCSDRGVRVVAYSPLGSRNKYTPPEIPSVVDHPRIVEIAAKAGMAPAQLLLTWNLQEGNVVLSKSVTPSRIQSNAELEIGVLSDEIMTEIREFGDANPLRILNPDWFYAAGGKFFPE